MRIHKIQTLLQYKQHLIKNDDIKKLKKIDTSLNERIKNHTKLYLNGYSWTAQANSKFLVDWQYANDMEINLRERLVCQKTKLNNRTRGCIHIFETLFKPQLEDSIYLTEQTSLLAKWMRKKYQNLYSSEFLTNSSWYHKVRISLKLFPRSICHQDLTQLSFESSKFDYVLSFDCIEHIPNYIQAFKEVFRTLKSNGKLLFSVPFDINQEKNLIRARIKDGKIIHLVEPEYHGDSISSQGCLSFYTFGWQLLQELREIGFNHVYILLYWSEKYCYLGGEQILICAEK